MRFRTSVATVILSSASVFAVLAACFAPTEITELQLKVGITSQSTLTSVKVGQTVTSPLTVTVSEDGGAPLPNWPVTFSSSVGGQLTPTETVTDGQGRAVLASWAVPTKSGSAQLTATARDGSGQTIATSTSITITPEAIDTAVASSAVTQSAVAGAAVQAPPSVRVADRYGNAIQGVNVTFTVAAGAGTVNGASLTTVTQQTGATGVATLNSWVLGKKAGANQVVAVATGLSKTVTFDATGVAGPPATINIDATANNQFAKIHSLVPVAPNVTVVDANDNPVANVAVRFAVTAGGGRVLKNSTDAGTTSLDTVTAANGVAAVYGWRLGSVAGAQTITVTLPSASSVASKTFTATATNAPVTVVASAGDAQTGTVGTQLPIAPTVKVTDASGAGVRNIPVVFAVTGGGGTVAQSTVRTDANGFAQSAWTMGRVSDDQVLTATVMSESGDPITFTGTTTGTLNTANLSGNPVRFAAFANPGPAIALRASLPDSARSRLLMDAVHVWTVDQYGNQTFQDGTAITVSTDSTSKVTLAGNLSAATEGGSVTFDKLTFSGKAGVANLRFTAGSLQSLSLPIAVTAGLPAQIALVTGDTQVAVQLTKLAKDPEVKVTDLDGNGVARLVVEFAVTGGGGQLSAHNVATDANGVARTSWTLGVVPGTNTLRAAVADSASRTTTFTGSTSGSGTLTAPSISGNPVNFTSTATDRASCSDTTAVTLGTPVSGSLNRTSDCLRALLEVVHQPTDFFKVTTTTQTHFSLALASTEFTTRLASDVWSARALVTDGASPVTQHYFVKAGTNRIAVTTSGTSAGAYTLSSTLNPALPTGCLNGIVTAGVTVTHTLDTGCNTTRTDGASAASKRYFVFVPGSTTLTVSMSSSALTPVLELRTISPASIAGTPSSTVAASNTGVAGTTPAQVSVTPTTGTFYEIRALSGGTAGPVTGSFTLTISSP